MADKNLYYVYSYLREDGTPYYIGKGKGDRIHKKHGRVKLPPKERRVFLTKDVSEKEALEKEIELIHLHGRKGVEEGGILLNIAPGGEGADTKSGKSCFNDGSRNAFFVDGEQPCGWVKGRCDKHNFSSKKQKTRASQPRPSAGETLRAKWANGDYANRAPVGVKGDLNPAKRPEVREKIRNHALANSAQKSINMIAMRKEMGAMWFKKNRNG